MNDELLENLKKSLSLSVEIEHGWYNERSLKVTLYWDHEKITEASTYLPDHQCEKEKGW